MTRKGYLALCAVSIILFATSMGLTLSSWVVEDNTSQQITLTHVTGKILETYNHGTLVYPSQTLDHVMQVQNTGPVDALVRMKIDKDWKDDQDGTSNAHLNTDNIQIRFNDTDWYWRESDGYFYYKGVLKPSETTKPLFETIYIDGKKTDPTYADKSIDITATMEMVQAAYNGASYWDMSLDTLGISYTENVSPQMPATAEFHSPSQGFSFSFAKDSFFINMENLLPGETSSQRIHITNHWDNPTTMYLKVQTNQKDISNKLVDTLLSKYATLTITCEDGTTLYSGPILNSDGTKSGISLGRVDAGETKNLNISIALDNRIDNPYRDLTANIQWVFRAEGQDTTVSPPQTGQSNYAGLYIILTGCSLLLLLITGRKLLRHSDKGGVKQK